MMKGDASSFRAELKGVRSKATGRKDTSKKSPRLKRKEIRKPESNENLNDTSQRDAQRRQHKEKLLEREARRKSKEENYVKTKLEAERNRRLRQGAPMTREERNALEARLRIEAESKYMPKPTTTPVIPVPEPTKKEKEEKPEISEERKREILERQAAELQRARLMEEEQSNKKHNERDQQYRNDDNDDDRTEDGYMDEDEDMREHIPVASDASNGWASQHNLENETPPPVHTTMPPQHHEQLQPLQHTQENRHEEQHMNTHHLGIPNAASASDWKQEETRINDDDIQKSARRELLPQFENVARVNGRDLKLRTFKVVKNTAHEALGVQFYTPEQGLGVRITALHMRGPFGRCGAFQDDDVLVEINGARVLNAGHSGVIDSIKTAFKDSNEMLVTVCRPEDLDDTPKDKNVTPEKEAPSTAWGRFMRSVKKPFNLFGSDARPQDDAHNKPPAIREEVLRRPVLTGQSMAPKGSPAKIIPPTPTPNSRHIVGNTGLPLSPPKMAVATPPAYLIYRADVRDLEAYKHNYMSKTTALISKFGGEWLARGGKITTLEGPDNSESVVLQRMVLIKFPTMDAAKAFFHSEDYQEARAQRLSIATAELTVLEGMPPLLEN
eukprot:m.12909 g.12909  ORF g.12909 m.12909 type:complete len:613 (-) comp4754_c0_seq1:150-1988(-)